MSKPEAPFDTPDCLDPKTCPLPFVISCTECDAGDDPALTSAVAAYMLGWRDIRCDHAGVSWNQLGICPECWDREAKET